MQAESVAQLVSARTPAAAGSALAGLQGGIGSLISSIRSAALELLAEFEVYYPAGPLLFLIVPSQN